MYDIIRLSRDIILFKVPAGNSGNQTSAVIMKESVLVLRKLTKLVM